jgi:MFS family permease
VALLGSAIGSLFGGPLADKLGRKPTVVIADVFLIAGPLLMGIADTINILLLGRFIVGVI